MAKEMMIIFVYDTQLLQREEDDPASAVLYFHPGWVSDDQKIALCGQIMGTYNFLKSTFAVPKIVSLQSGKFATKEYGRYTLAIGTDRNIPDWVLEQRRDTMDYLITFYHKDLPTMSAIYENRDSLCAKLYSTLENYLRVLIYSGNGFSNIATIQLPKSASGVFLESLQILQHCQESEYVLGGLMLYHNMVLSTQVSTCVTQRFVLTDPYRIKSPAELVNVSFDLPQGVQLLQVYLDEAEYAELKEESSKRRGIYDKNFKNKNSTRFNQHSKEPVFSAIKREQSIIFTTVPEEDASPHSPNFTVSINVTPAKKSRPKFLNLRSNTIDLGNSLTDAPKIIPGTPFRGQTSVCSTPMAELNKVLHQSVLSICLNPEIDDSEVNKLDNNDSLSAELLSRAKFRANPYFPLDNVFLANIRKYASTSNLLLTHRDLLLTNRRNSTGDPTFHALNSDNKLISRCLYKYLYQEQTKFISLDQQHLKTLSDHSGVDKPCTSYDFIAQSASKLSSDRSAHAQRRRSLNLPLKSLSFDASSKPRASQGVLLTPLMSKLTILADDQSSSGFSSRTSSPSPTKEFTDADEGCRRDNIISRGLIVCSTEISEDIKDAARRNNNNRDASAERLDSDITNYGNNDKSSRNIDNVIGEVDRERKCSAAMLDANVYMTSNGKKTDLLGSSKNGPRRGGFKHRSDTGCSKEVGEDAAVKRVVLFVCGQEDMVVGMILEEEAVLNDVVVKKLYEVCVDHLHSLSKTLIHCLSTNPHPSAPIGIPTSRQHHPSTTHRHSPLPSASRHHQPYHTATGNSNEPPYSYLSVDTDQCRLQQAGPWAGNGYGIVTHLHKDFKTRADAGDMLTEIVLRDDENVVYAYKSGNTEVFYHQAANGSVAGLPPPTDLMGTASNNARTRLERDQAVILL